MSGEMAGEVQDALYDTIEGSSQADHIRGRIAAFMRRLPEDMTVQEILESLKVGAAGDEDEE